LTTEAVCTKHWPNYDWQTIWEYLYMTPVSNNTKGVWYKIIHDVLPTNERLNKIHIPPTNICKHCTGLDTLQHRITDCGEGKETWEWTCDKMATIMRIDLKSGWCDHTSDYGPRRNIEQSYGSSQ
jgi:hypothetical protein